MGTCPCPKCTSSRVDTTGLGPDECRVLQLIADRLRKGATTYGVLDIAKDNRDWRKEALEEDLDSTAYKAIALLKGMS